MKFKLDENFPVELAADLKQLGHEADTVYEEKLQGADDPTVVRAAHQEQRILMTLDKGIGNIHSYPAKQHSGIVVFRPDRASRTAVLSFVRLRLPEVLEAELAGRLTVVTATRLRQR